MNTGAQSLAGTSSLLLNSMKEWSSTTAPYLAPLIGHMLLKCFSSLTFSLPPFLPWRPLWLRRVSPAATCSVSFSGMYCCLPVNSLVRITHLSHKRWDLFNIVFFFFFFFFNFLCHSWLAIWRDFVITQDVPWPSEARNSVWAKPVSPSLSFSLKLFTDFTPRRCTICCLSCLSYLQWREPDSIRTRVADPYRVVHQLQSDCIKSARNIHCTLWAWVNLSGETSITILIKILYDDY